MKFKANFMRQSKTIQSTTYTPFDAKPISKTKPISCTPARAVLLRPDCHGFHVRARSFPSNLVQFFDFTAAKSGHQNPSQQSLSLIWPRKSRGKVFFANHMHGLWRPVERSPDSISRFFHSVSPLCFSVSTVGTSSLLCAVLDNGRNAKSPA